MKWKKKHGIKDCPHCGLATSRISGCPDMICSGCKKNWNWYYDDLDWGPNSEGFYVFFYFLPHLLDIML